MKSETASHTEETSLVVGVKLLYTGHQAVEIEVPGSLGKKNRFRIPVPIPHFVGEANSLPTTQRRSRHVLQVAVKATQEAVLGDL